MAPPSMPLSNHAFEGLATCGVEPNMKSVSKPPFQTQDRYAILQRKLEDLERLHNDGKKAASFSFSSLVPFAANPCLF